MVLDSSVYVGGFWMVVWVGLLVCCCLVLVYFWLFNSVVVWFLMVWFLVMCLVVLIWVV